MKKPNFFIVGAPKCGTSSFYFYLKKHPEIFFPKLKEVSYFGSDLSFQDEWYNSDINRYLKWYEGVKGEKRVGDASVWYLYSNQAAKEIKEFSPKADIIIMLRNPADMLYSLHSEFVFGGTENIKDFSKALEAEEGRKNGLIDNPARNKKFLYYSEVINYHEQVKRYLELFGKDKVHIIIFKDYVQNTPEIYKKTLKFLGVDHNYKINFKKILQTKYKNPNKKPRSYFLSKILNYPPKPVLNMVRLLLPRRIRFLVSDTLINLNAKYKKRPRMSSRLRKKLVKKFTPEINKLSDLIDRDLSYWTKT